MFPSLPFSRLLFLSGLIFLGVFPLHPTGRYLSFLRVSPVLAEDEEEFEGIEEEDDEGFSPTSEHVQQEEDRRRETVQTVTRYHTVTKTIVVTDPGYDRDSDGDGLVDKIDPDPGRHQKEYFTDTDGDGVPNPFDQHHDEDDFAYFEIATDDDQNGVIDSLERE